MARSKKTPKKRDNTVSMVAEVAEDLGGLRVHIYEGDRLWTTAPLIPDAAHHLLESLVFALRDWAYLSHRKGMPSHTPPGTYFKGVTSNRLKVETSPSKNGAPELTTWVERSKGKK